MISKDLARKIRYLQISTRKAVNDVLAGEYGSVFKGRGMEFDEVREYQPGDDVRAIDWNVTARAGKPFVKRFREERELTVVFVVDLSASGSFGSVCRLKNDVAAELCALLAFSAVKNNDKVGLIVFTDQVEKFIPPQKGVRHVLRVIREILSFKPGQTQTDIAGALDYLGRVLGRRAVVFLISDFQADGFDHALRVVSRRHDMIAITVRDPRESAFPDAGLLELEDVETGEVILIDTGSVPVRRRYELLSSERDAHLMSLFRSSGVDQIEVWTDKGYMQDLVKFFKARARRV